MKTILLKHRPVDPDSPAFVYDAGKPWPENTSGLTVRAEIARSVLAGFAACNLTTDWSYEGFADKSVQMADALLARLNANPDEQ